MTPMTIDFTGDELERILYDDQGAAILMQKVLNEVLQAEMSEHLRADRHERTDARRGYRHGSYRRQLTTRVGRLELEVPRDREGTFQSQLFDRYQRSEKALVLALMEMVVQGVSTRRVKKITTELCGKRFTKSTVSRLTGRLDEQVKAWAERELPEEIPFLIADAMQLKVRRQGAVRSTTALIAVGITEEGQREILGFEIAYGETKQAWKDLLQLLRERGLRRIELATTDGRKGLEQAIRATFPGSIWCRCHAHFTRNVLQKTPSSYKKRMHQLLGRMLEAHSPQEARALFDAAYEEIAEQAPKALTILEDGLEDAITVLALPAKYRRRLRTTNMLERLIEELRRREKVIRIFPNMESAWRLVGALLAEYHEEWSTGRKYLRMDEYFEWRASLDDASLDDTEQEDTKQTIAA